MHHLANSMTKLCHGREQKSAGWVGVLMYDCSGGGKKLLLRYTLQKNKEIVFEGL